MTQANTHLLEARFAKGLTVVDVERLLGHKRIGTVSRVEHGGRPSLKTALKLEIIYSRPLAALFPDLYARYQKEIASARNAPRVSASRGGQL